MRPNPSSLILLPPLLSGVVSGAGSHPPDPPRGPGEKDKDAGPSTLLTAHSIASSADYHERAVRPVPLSLFSSLERMSRLVDITYCVGTTGIVPPFSCVSRCRDFPSLHLVQTWNTGALMTDSCGYIAVDHGAPPLGGRGGGGRRRESESESDEGGENEGGWTDGPAIIVAFRGTYSITNTVIDLSTIPQEYVPYPAHPHDGGDMHDEPPKCDNCTVHSGFLASWLMARKVVIPAVTAAREKHPGYPVRLVGHSLGGAVAALAGLEMRLSLGWGDDVQVTTFGEPRVGNSGLAAYVDSAFALDDERTSGRTSVEDPAYLSDYYRRVTHVDDPVPLLPLTEWGFRPHAGEVFIAKRDLQPAPEDLRLCHGDSDPVCIAGGEEDEGKTRWRGGKSSAGGEIGLADDSMARRNVRFRGLPSRLKLWQLLFAHRDYFWRLGLCLPGGDPVDWGRHGYEPAASQKGGVSEDL